MTDRDYIDTMTEPTYLAMVDSLKARIKRDPPPESDEGKYILWLTDLIQRYEARHYPLD